MRTWLVPRARSASSSTRVSRSTLLMGAGACSSAAARTSRSSTSRSIACAGPSTPDRSSSASTAPGSRRATSSDSRCVANGLWRSWEMSATSWRCLVTADSTLSNIRFMVAASRLTSSRGPVDDQPPVELLGADGVDLGTDAVESAQGAPDQQPDHGAEQDHRQRHAEEQQRAQAPGGLVHGLEAAADHHGHVTTRRGARHEPRPVGLRLLVVRAVERAPLGLGGLRRSRDGAAAGDVGGGGEHGAVRGEDLGDTVVAHLGQHDRQPLPLHHRDQVVRGGPGGMVGGGDQLPVQRRQEHPGSRPQHQGDDRDRRERRTAPQGERVEATHLSSTTR